MKNQLLWTAAFAAFMLTACGPTESEKKEMIATLSPEQKMALMTQYNQIYDDMRNSGCSICEATHIARQELPDQIDCPAEYYFLDKYSLDKRSKEIKKQHEFEAARERAIFREEVKKAQPIKIKFDMELVKALQKRKGLQVYEDAFAEAFLGCSVTDRKTIMYDVLMTHRKYRSSQYHFQYRRNAGSFTTMLQEEIRAAQQLTPVISQNVSVPTNGQTHQNEG